MRAVIFLPTVLFLLSPPALAAAPAKVVTAKLVVELAQSHSPTLRMAILELKRAGLAVHGEEHRYRPTFVADLGYLRSANPTLKTDEVSVGSSHDLALGMGISHQFAFGMTLGAELDIGGTARNYTAPDVAEPLLLGPGYGVDLRLSIAQPLLRGMGTDYGEAELRVARHQRTAAQHARERAASEVVRAVLAAYWELWYAQRALAIQIAGLEVTRRELSDAQKRAKAGALAELEVLPLLTEEASVLESVLSAETEVVSRRVELARLTGEAMVGGQELRAADASPDIPDVVEDEASVVTSAKENAYQLAELKAAVEQARVRALVAEHQVMPKLDAQTWMTVSGLGNADFVAALEMFGKFEAVSVFVGLNFELPTDSTLLQSAADRASVDVETARERLRDATEQLTADAVDQRARLWAARQRLTLAERTAQLAVESVRGQKKRFEAGDGTATELIVAEQQRRQAELRAARGRADVAVAHLALLHLTGRLLASVVTD